MQRALLLLCLALPFFASAASAGYRATLRGDPLIDAQWAAQHQAPPAVYGRNAPIDLRGTPRGGLLSSRATSTPRSCRRSSTMPASTAPAR